MIFSSQHFASISCSPPSPHTSHFSSSSLFLLIFLYLLFSPPPSNLSSAFPILHNLSTFLVVVPPKICPLVAKNLPNIYNCRKVSTSKLSSKNLNSPNFFQPFHISSRRSRSGRFVSFVLMSALSVSPFLLNIGSVDVATRHI